MKPTHPVELLVYAFATQEGAFGAPGTIPVDRHNPLDLRFAHQANATRPDGSTEGNLASEPIAVFSDSQAGICGGFRDIWAKVAKGMTVRQIVYTFAPPSENNTAKYLADVLEWTGLPADVPVLKLLPPPVDMRKAQ